MEVAALSSAAGSEAGAGVAANSAGAAVSAEAGAAAGGGVAAPMSLDHSSMIELRFSPPWDMDRLSEVHIKTTAAPQVILLINVAGPRVPKTVPDDPPKAAPIPAPLPACNRTVRTRMTAAVMWMETMIMFMLLFPLYKEYSFSKPLVGPELGTIAYPAAG